jgi:hypothetical protein
MSAAARKRIRDAQRKRWAESKKESAPSSPVAPKTKRRLSKAGKAAIVAALKKRWAAKRVAPAVGKKAIAKKSAVKASRKATKNTVKKAAPKVAVKKLAPKKSTSAKTAKAPVKKVAKKSAPVTPQPTAAAEAASTPGVVV